MAAGSSSKQKYVVVTAQGEAVEVDGVTKVVASEDGTTVAFFDGDDQIAAFRSFGSYRRG